MNLHIVIDAHRQHLRCNHCRTEVPLPAAGTISSWIAATNDFEKPHAACLPRPLPAPGTFSGAAEGQSFKRDEQGLWWAWTLLPTTQVMSVRVPEFRVRPLPLAQALQALRAQVDVGEESDNHDDQRRAQQAVLALASEGMFV